MTDEVTRKRLTIFWDVENVHDEQVTHTSMTDVIRESGELVKAYAFADWDSRRSMAEHLHSIGYDLIHVPDSKDNASDYKMASYIMEHLVHYTEVEEYVLVTGDGDFKLIAGALREQGRDLWLISNPVITSSELSDLATRYSDIYSFRPSPLDCSDPEDCAAKALSPEARQIAAVQLQEAIRMVIEAGHKPGVGHVKHVVKSINPNFNEKTIGFESWMDFISWAESEEYICVEGELPFTILTLPDTDTSDTIRLHEASKSAFDTLVKVVENRVDQDKSTSLSDIAEELDDQGIVYQNVGYPKIEDFIASAEKRGLVRVVAIPEENNDPTLQPVCTIGRLRKWFERRKEEHFGTSVNIPKDVFLKKIADVLHESGITLSRLEEYLSDDQIRENYKKILDASGLPFLPPYQMLMATILLGRGLSCEDTVIKVNEELQPLSITLSCPIQ
jgi:hypothetical protein